MGGFQLNQSGAVHFHDFILGRAEIINRVEIAFQRNRNPAGMLAPVAGDFIGQRQTGISCGGERNGRVPPAFA